MSMSIQRQDNFSQSSNDFVFCRVGFQQEQYTENLQELLDQFNDAADFISIPLSDDERATRKDHKKQTTTSSQTNKTESINQCNSIYSILPDLALHNDSWQTRICLQIRHDYLDYYHFGSAKKFDSMLQHALYLTCPSIVITVPDSEAAILSVASSCNRRLSDTPIQSKLLFKIPFEQRDFSLDPPTQWTSLENFYLSKLNQCRNLDTSGSSCRTSSQRSELTSDVCDDQQTTNMNVDPQAQLIAITTTTTDNTHIDDNCPNKSLSQSSIPLETTAWQQWNFLTSFLNIDNRFGVALVLSERLVDEEVCRNRWAGEPVRLLIIPDELFVMSPNQTDSIRLPPKFKNFIKEIVISNSMKTNLLLSNISNPELTTYHLAYLSMFSDNLKIQNQDPLLDWNDKIQSPLQPLSSNLDSSTYTIFETDPIKYLKYRDAMKLALIKIIDNNLLKPRKLVLMVLGAGRGPLVDSLLDAIESINFGNFTFQIYALDKNPSSVRSLNYKLEHKWKTSEILQIQVVKADMRVWSPGVKADLIASELLGSLADNELSPECIDGAARFAGPETICIPQEYSSYVAPICSFKLRYEVEQEKHRTQRPAYDQIYVSKLSNYYMISKPQRLFTFEHVKLDEKILIDRTNEKYQKLSFWSDADTVCHGFAGYFHSKLFDTETISTVFGSETDGMFSWFPAFIPLQEPIPLSKGLRIDLHFWRKESISRVWYEWAVTHPVRTRIYGLNGVDTAMSKFT